MPPIGRPTSGRTWTRSSRPSLDLLLLSSSECTALEPSLRHRLLDAVGTTIDDYGGSFVVNFETVLIAATRRG
jgi:hypothetical protein